MANDRLLAKLECGPLVYSTRDIGVNCEVSLVDLRGHLRKTVVNGRSLFEAASHGKYYLNRFSEEAWPPPEEQIFCVVVTGRKAHYHRRPYFVRGTRLIEWENGARPIAPRNSREARVEPFALMRRKILRVIR